MGLLNLVTVGQERYDMENFWTKNPIISNRRTVRYYGIKQDPGRMSNTSFWTKNPIYLTGQLIDIMGSNKIREGVTKLSHSGVRILDIKI